MEQLFWVRLKRVLDGLLIVAQVLCAMNLISQELDFLGASSSPCEGDAVHSLPSRCGREKAVSMQPDSWKKQIHQSKKQKKLRNRQKLMVLRTSLRENSIYLTEN
ncbi:UNVERIFIED_CONTAM: hypothetical protein K2H54_063856 [Gekko kuhli]